MCVLRTHNSIPFLEKVLTTFSIPDKIFPKTNLLIYALIRAYINRTLDVILDEVNCMFYSQLIDLVLVWHCKQCEVEFN